MDNNVEGDTVEIKVPAPWGHIAVKTWGDETYPAVFCFHGILDNAGTFDRLIKLLPKTFYYISVDLPGHGHSSHFPPHLPIHTINYILVYKILVKYFNREKYVIMGHSYGGQIGFIFSQVYPQYVERLVLLDAIVPLPVPASCYIDYVRDKMEMFQEMEQKLATRSAPSYTYEEAVKRVMSSRNYGTLNEDAAKALVDRALVPVDDSGHRFRFVTDQRLKHFINPIHDIRYMVDAYKHAPVTCPVLILLAKQSLLNKHFKRLNHGMSLSNNNIVFKLIEGHHDVHNETPEAVAPIVSKFLLSKNHKL